MRPYRGKKIETDKWVYGSYCQIEGQHFIIVEDAEYIWQEDAYRIRGMVEVDPETVGQSTGKKDSKRTKEYPKGQKIYEGDWAKMPFHWRYNTEDGEVENEGYYEGEVVIIASAGVCIRNPIRHLWNLTEDTPEEKVKLKQYRKISGYITTVVGNRFDNPELMEKTQ